MCLVGTGDTDCLPGPASQVVLALLQAHVVPPTPSKPSLEAGGGRGKKNLPYKMLPGPLEFTLAPLPCLLNIPACDSGRGSKQLFCEGPGLAGAGGPLPTSEPLSEAVTSLPRPCWLLGGQEGGQWLGLSEGLAQSTEGRWAGLH